MPLLVIIISQCSKLALVFHSAYFRHVWLLNKIDSGLRTILGKIRGEGEEKMAFTAYNSHPSQQVNLNEKGIEEQRYQWWSK